MLFVAGAAILFASKGIFSKALYQRGVGLRTAGHGARGARHAAVRLDRVARHPLPAPMRRAPRPSRPRAVLAAVVAGIVCYYVGALVDFWALTLIDASIERVLLFSYPAMVVLISSMHDAARTASARVVFAMLVTYVGIFFAMGGVDLDRAARQPVRRRAGADRRAHHGHLLPDRRTLHARARQHALRRHRHELGRPWCWRCTSRCSARSASWRRCRRTTGCCSASWPSPACSCPG